MPGLVKPSWLRKQGKVASSAARTTEARLHRSRGHIKSSIVSLSHTDNNPVQEVRRLSPFYICVRRLCVLFETKSYKPILESRGGSP